MRKLLWKLLTSLLFSFILVMGFVTTAYAYNTVGYTWSSSSINYYYDNYNSSRGKSFIGTGASTWNSTDVTFTNNASYNVYCTEVSNSKVSWDGLTSYSYSGNRFTSETLQLNMAITSTWNSDGALKSVAVHEFGHALGLDHVTNGKVIMNPYTWGTNSRYGDFGLTTPQTDDKNGANDLY